MISDTRQILVESLVLEVQSGSERAFTHLHDLWRGDLHRLTMLDKAAGCVRKETRAGE